MSVFEEKIPQIFKSEFKQPPIFIEPLKGGEASNVFKVKTKDRVYCIKFNELHGDRSVMQMESKVMSELKKLDINTPEPIKYGAVNVQENEKHEYLIMSFIEGELLSKQWNKLAPAEVEEVSNGLFNILNKFRQLKTKGFGPLDEGLCGLYKSFPDYMNYEVEKLKNSDAVSVVDERVLRSATKILRDFADEEKVTSTFVQADFRLRNFIYNGGELYLFDFSNAMSMDPLFDFVRFLKVESSQDLLSKQEADYFKDIYLENYYSVSDYEKKEKIYHLLLTFRLLPWFYSTKKKKHLNSTLNELTRVVNK